MVTNAKSFHNFYLFFIMSSQTSTVNMENCNDHHRMYLCKHTSSGKVHKKKSTTVFRSMPTNWRFDFVFTIQGSKTTHTLQC